MKYLTFLFPILLILLSPTVLSNDKFEFVMSCTSNESEEICNKLERVFILTGEIIESNLELNTIIKVLISYESLGIGDEIAGTSPTFMKFVSPQDQVERLYHTALLKQLNTEIDFKDEPDMIISINSDERDNFWFPGDGDIKTGQRDISHISLHEMIHGLGFSTSWDFFSGRNKFLIPRLSDSIIYLSDAITFEGFYETVFDAKLVHLEDPNNLNSAKSISDIVKSLNGFTPKGTIFPSATVLFDTFEKSDQLNDAKLMLTYATTKSALAFIHPCPHGTFMLETSEIEFDPGSGISHFDQKTFENTADFLMTPFLDDTLTLQARLQNTGNNPGRGIGPKLRSVLKTLGYTINPNLPSNEI